MASFTTSEPKVNVVNACKKALNVLHVDYTFKPNKYTFKCIAYPDAVMTSFQVCIVSGLSKINTIEIEKQHDARSIVWWSCFCLEFANQLSTHIPITRDMKPVFSPPTCSFSYDTDTFQVYKQMASSEFVDINFLGASILYKFIANGEDVNMSKDIENIVDITVDNLVKNHPPLQCLSIHTLCKLVEQDAFSHLSRQAVLKTIARVTDVLGKTTTMQYLETHRQCALFLQKTIQVYDGPKKNAKNILSRKILYDDTRLNTIISSLLIKI